MTDGIRDPHDMGELIYLPHRCAIMDGSGVRAARQVSACIRNGTPVS
jgi:hypothetical protein